ncbi:hypothetical protein, variant 1 [Aphanomyces invadans]|uniref:Peptidyl-prolyl cis-trans isomerase n=1 Tax=Aphanomyces invadans TaxID=157072 RepID=A0A024TRL4_9STRA|nr:hypothetical protein, variant 1 [Aphanomyces invadans]ETV96790.1 hypothetical protein, variant 1 [Aphanomyces invadans]|eukprot:XP_008874566.1 hypothetical protein, variant 1 [Aphanomyces invadans]
MFMLEPSHLVDLPSSSVRMSCLSLPRTFECFAQVCRWICRMEKAHVAFLQAVPSTPWAPRSDTAAGAYPALGYSQTGFSTSLVHRVVRDSLLQAGDIDGEGGSCAFSTPTFEDENFILRHVGMGTVGMVNAGPDTNGSQFYICFTSAPWLDNKHVVFGALLGESSFETLAKLHDTVATESGQPLQVVRIAHSGQLYPV